jgi:peptidoglycan/xylan/chitin deacetylase (PgdA/CDA1 family)
MEVVLIKAAALQVVKVSAAAADRLGPRRAGVSILLYHRVGGSSGVELDLPQEAFARQIELIASTGRASTLDDALTALTGPAAPSGAEPIVVTFDDGTADFMDRALPILERFGVPATIYLATDHIERGTPFPHDGRPLSWSGILDALATGLVTVGSHTHTHRVLARVSAEEAETELNRSCELIEDRLGVSARHFAYPKAVPGSPAAEAVVRARFASAALGGLRPNPYGRTDPFRLRRSAIQASDGMRWFRRKLDGGMALEGTLRTMLNGRRYARTDR